MERKFNIIMHVPLGTRNGTLYFIEDNGKISGTLEVLGNKNFFTGTMKQDGFLKFSGRMKSFLRTFPYCAEGKIVGRKIELTVTGDRHSFVILGKDADFKEDVL